MKAQYIEAVNYSISAKFNQKLFLGGGISNCADWQKEAIEKLSESNITIYNPRRSAFDLSKEIESEIQIIWEHKFLRQCNQVLFYFPEETLCPITLFELGSALERNYPVGANSQKIFIGCHPKYARYLDVRVQTKLIGAGAPIVWCGLDYLLSDVIEYNKNNPNF